MGKAGKKIVRAPFQQGRLSVGPRAFDVEGGIVIGLAPDDAEIAGLCRVWGLTIGDGKSPSKPASSPLPLPKATAGEEVGEKALPKAAVDLKATVEKGGN